mmetsp:Transcript_37362/g.107278  ORF Transcript_37362/g.107278 Transcript_37362/m.107278 type:complete len:240 (-) Transcript_37362:224-943(-)
MSPSSPAMRVARPCTFARRSALRSSILPSSSSCEACASLLMLSLNSSFSASPKVCTEEASRETAFSSPRSASLRPCKPLEISARTSFFRAASKALEKVTCWVCTCDSTSSILAMSSQRNASPARLALALHSLRRLGPAAAKFAALSAATLSTCCCRTSRMRADSSPSICSTMCSRSATEAAEAETGHRLDVSPIEGGASLNLHSNSRTSLSSAASLTFIVMPPTSPRSPLAPPRPRLPE